MDKEEINWYCMRLKALKRAGKKVAPLLNTFGLAYQGKGEITGADIDAANDFIYIVFGLDMH